MKTIFRLGLLALAFLSIYGREALACIHFPASYKDTITEGKKEIFAFHDGKFAHMILSTHLTAKKLPSDLAWVIPFPSLPVSYEQMKPNFFKDVHEFIKWGSRFSRYGAMTLGLSKGGSGKGIEVHEVQQIGEYQIRPIEILEESSGKELNAWLAENKFNAMPDELQKYYLKKGAVFLAIRMKPSESEISPKPLHIVYPSNRITIPLKFTHDSRMFDLQVYFFSAKPNRIKLIDSNQYATGGLRSFSGVAKSRHDARIWCGEAIPYDEEKLQRFPGSMKLLERFPNWVRSLGRFPELTKLLQNRRGYITSCRSIERLNDVSRPLKDLVEDPGLSVEELL